MDPSFYASQFDTARELLSNNTSEAATGLYSILCALYELSEMPNKHKQQFQQHTIHEQYKPALISIYLIYYTIKKTDLYNRKTYTRHDSFILLQQFKQNCFKEITKALEQIQPQEGIQWRMSNKWTPKK